MDSAASAPPGWYDDGTGATRWWDGLQWTDHRFDPENVQVAAGPPRATPSRRKPIIALVAGVVGLMVFGVPGVTRVPDIPIVAVFFGVGGTVAVVAVLVGIIGLFARGGRSGS